MKPYLITLVALSALAAIFSTSCDRQSGDLLIADFEDTGYGEWTVEGDAFGSGPSDGGIDDAFTLEGFLGEKLAVSNNGGIESTGKIISPGFKIKRDYINFLAAGGLDAGKVCINLLVEGETVATFPEPEDVVVASRELGWHTWDVSGWRDHMAVIEVVDQKEEDWGAIAVDHLVQSDLNKKNTAFLYDVRREIPFDSRYLNIPIAEGTGKQRMIIYLEGAKVGEFVLDLAAGEPDYWMFLDVSDWSGMTGVIEIAKMAEDSKGLESMVVDQTVKGFENLYGEKDRPQFHYTSRRGWHNDPNGLVFYQGEYHLFYQHNPLGWSWGNMTWGHAISRDLVHWQEQSPALYPDELGTMFSGSGVIDWNNTTGFQQGEEAPMILVYTAAGGTSRWSEDQPFTQCIAYSTDKGRTFTKYAGNPVLGHLVDGNRDPKVTWYEAGQVWVMALFLEGNTFGLFTSRDLKSWTSIQEIEIEEGAECPDFFPMALDGDPAQTKWVLTAANGRFLAGSFDGRTFTPETASHRSEWGKNYYAVQTYSDVKDGRRIQFGWMAGSVFEGMPFNQQFSVARELTLRTTPGGIRLYGHPVREIESLHGEVQSWDTQTLSPGTNPLKELEGELYHILAEFDLAENSASEFGLNLRGFDINYNILAHKLSTYRPTDGAQSEVSLLPENSMITLEILVDIGSVEVFANGGLVPMAFFYLPEDDENGLSLYCKDGPLKISSLEVYEMKSIWNIDVE